MAALSPRAFWLTALLLGVPGSVMASDTLKLELEPAYQGNISGQAAYPVIADLQNLGPDAKGVLSLEADSSRMTYPVELPRGSHKRVFTYPLNGMQSVHFSLETDQGRAGVDFTPRSGRADGIPVLLITDVPGELSFIISPPSTVKPSDQQNQTTAASLVDMYAKPASVPTRPMGFAGIGKVILGSGSERLSDEQIEALKLWASTGGTLAFIGGASSPVLSDTRWVDVIPAHSFHVMMLPGSSVLTRLSGSEAESVPQFSVSSGLPAVGATATKEGSTLLWSESSYGLGRMLFIAFNPFEGPLSHWNGRGVALTRILRLDTGMSANAFMAGFTTNIQSTPGGVSLPVSHSVAEDPFSMTLPPTSQIFTILAAYFVVVVPINFLVLKKLRRGELAWFTAPVISLAFAALLFTAAGSLYSAKLSSLSSGVVICQEGNQEGLFVGSTDLFVPHAGSYDLKLKGVDSLGDLPGENGYQPYGYGSVDGDQSGNFDPIDIGEVVVPSMPANNLAFRRMIYRQRIPSASWFHVKLQSTGDASARCDIVNTSPFTLKNAQLAVGARLMDLGDIQPGKHLSRNVAFMHEAPPSAFSATDARNFTLNRDRVALVAQLAGFRPGPQIGDPVAGRGDLSFALFSAWEGGSR